MRPARRPPLALIAVATALLASAPCRASDRGDGGASAMRSWVGSIATADSVVVTRFAWHVSSTDPSAQPTRSPQRVVRPERTWCARLTEVLRDAEVRPGGDECTVSVTAEELPSLIDVQVRAFHGGRSQAIDFTLSSWCAEVRRREKLVGTLGIRAIADRLLPLVQEALADDAPIQRLAKWSEDQRLVIQQPDGSYAYLDSLPVPLLKVPPVYPDDARERGIDGTVGLLANVDRAGVVADVRVERSIALLDSAAVRAVRAWRFRPAIVDGHPVAVWISVPVRFNLH